MTAEDGFPQVEQREGNTLLHKQTSHHITTEKKNNCNTLFKDTTFPVDFPLDNLFNFKTKRAFFITFPPSLLFQYTGTHI